MDAFLNWLNSGGLGTELLFDEAPVGWVVFGRDKHIRMVNRTFSAMLGYQREELVGLDINQITAEEDRSLTDRAFGQLQKVGRVVLEKRFVTKSGDRLVPARVTARTILNDTGQIRFIIAAVADLSEVKLVADLVDHKETEHRAVLDGLAVGVLIQGPRSEILYYNPQALGLLGVSQDQLLGRSSFDPTWNVIHEDGSLFPGETHPVPRAIETRKPVRQVIMGVYHPLRQERVWLNVDALPELAPDGSVERVVCTFVDITSSRRNEAGRRLLAQAVESTSQGIIITGADRLVLSANKAFQTMTGYVESEILGRDCRFLRGPLTEIEMTDRIRQALNMGTEFSGRLRNHRRDGTMFWNDLTISPVRDALGTLTHFIGVIRDVTEQEVRQAETRDLERQLQQSQKMESLGLLASGIAHDINNVLGAISATAEARRESGQDFDPTWSTVLKAVIRGRETVGALLNVTRQSSAERVRFNWNEVIREQVGLLQHSTLARVTVETVLDPKLPQVWGDVAGLGHALLNLCVNALDAMKNNLSDKRLTLESRATTDGEVEVRVQDNGSGMTEDVLAHAFDPFFTTKRQGEGTGLGLTMVYNLVKANAGHLEVDSLPGRGTSITLRFPAVTPSDADAGATQSPVAEKENTRRRILLVDDDTLIRESVCELLRILKFEVTEAGGGLEALDLLASGAPIDTVLLDMNMPGFGGAETLRRLRVLRPTLTVFLMTGLVDQQVLDLVKDTPGVGLLGKPFTAQELKARLGQSV